MAKVANTDYGQASASKGKWGVQRKQVFKQVSVDSLPCQRLRECYAALVLVSYKSLVPTDPKNILPFLLHFNIQVHVQETSMTYKQVQMEVWHLKPPFLQ